MRWQSSYSGVALRTEPFMREIFMRTSPKRRFDDDRFPVESLAADVVGAHADGGGFAEYQINQRG